MTDIPELTEAQFARAISARLRRRLAVGHFESGENVVALRRFVGLTQTQFAQAIGISVHTLRNWEQGRRRPEGPAIALLRIAARHPRIIRENVESAARLLNRRREAEIPLFRTTIRGQDGSSKSAGSSPMRSVAM